MKPSQVLATILTLIACLAGITWIANSNLLKPKPPTDLPVQKITVRADGEKTESPEGDGHDHDHDHDADDKEKEPPADRNPFTFVATTTEHPKAKIENTDYAFGRMVLGETGKHDFVIRNEGKAPLKLAKGPTQCKCTLSGLRDKEILPGEEGLVHLEWTPKDKGEFQQSATIWTNDPDNKEIVLSVMGQMFSELDIQPQGGWKLGTVHPQRPALLEGLIASSIFENFEITKVESSSDRVVMMAFPITPEGDEENPYLSGYRLQGTVDAGDGQQISETVTFHTTLEKYPTIEMKIEGVKSGPALLIAPFWYSAERLLQLGVVDAKKGKTFRVTVMIEPGEEPLKFTEIQAIPSFLKVDLKQEPSGATAAKERYTLTIEVPPGSPAGSWTRPNMGTLKLKTNRENPAELPLNVDLIVQ